MCTDISKLSTILQPLFLTKLLLASKSLYGVNYFGLWRRRGLISQARLDGEGSLGGEQERRLRVVEGFWQEGCLKAAVGLRFNFPSFYYASQEVSIN